MGQIVNNQPSGGRIVDSQPKVGVMVDNQPSGAVLNEALSNKLITRGYDALMPMGLLLAITYPTGGTFTTEYNP